MVLLSFILLTVFLDSFPSQRPPPPTTEQSITSGSGSGGSEQQIGFLLFGFGVYLVWIAQQQRGLFSISSYRDGVLQICRSTRLKSVGGCGRKCHVIKAALVLHDA